VATSSGKSRLPALKQNEGCEGDGGHTQ
jgi:hypothetical protein